jgi:hypothetical protein
MPKKFKNLEDLRSVYVSEPLRAESFFCIIYAANKASSGVNVERNTIKYKTGSRLILEMPDGADKPVLSIYNPRKQKNKKILVHILGKDNFKKLIKGEGAL